MNRNTLSALVCPGCRVHYELIDLNISSQSNSGLVEQGALCCPSCHIAVPVCRGFPLFDEAKPRVSSSLTSWVAQITEKWFVPRRVYRQFLETKAERGMFDLYAAFQPFNESTRALYPFLQLLRDILNPGDIILDTWCRTGWSAELLAGLFPEQHVVAIWEGNGNVLGYRGFDFWLNSACRAPNLDIIFTHPDHALPLATDSVALVHGLDSLHRYRHQSFIPEVLRVCRDDGVLIFPHIHLSNSEPEPFFERGCQQHHGRDWREWLDVLTGRGNRSAWVLPEVPLFEQQQSEVLIDDHDTDHYNALVVIAPSDWEGRELPPNDGLEVNGVTRFVSNPLLDVSPHTGRIHREGALSGEAEKLLERHPCYRERLDTCGKSISALEAVFCWYARQGCTLNDITTAMAIDASAALELANSLCRRELLHPAPISRAMFDLQEFYGHGCIPVEVPACFYDAWSNAQVDYGDLDVLHWLNDGSALGYGDVDFIVSGIRRAFEESGLKVGSRLVIFSHHHPEAILAIWAAWLSGIVVVPIDPELPHLRFSELLETVHADMLFSDRPLKSTPENISVILFDDEEGATPGGFSDWLEPFLGQPVQGPARDPGNLAAILFTSGSTGTPKGVMLSQSALMASGFEMARHYHWKNEILLSMGPLSMMSGLRNACVASLVSRSTVLLPATCTRRYPATAWEQSVQQGATVITTVPAWLTMLLARPLGSESTTLKQLLLTGAPLPESLKQRAEERLGCLVANYYGLTETGGICAGTSADIGDSAGTLGIPTDNALVQIVDERGELVAIGDVGEIRVRSNQIMSGYWQNPEATSAILRDGWLWTGDKGSWDEHGQMILAGREDDAIKLRDGSLFHPHLLEKLLSSIPGVLDVAMTLAGNPEKLTALVVCQPSLEQVRAHFMASHGEELGPRCLPEHWVQVELIPRNSNGKVLRSNLAAMI